MFKGVISSLTKILNLLNSGNKPIAAVMLAVTLLSRKLKDLNAPLQQKLGDLKSRLQGGDTLGRIGNLFENKDQKQNRLDNELAEQEEIVRLLREKYSLIEGTLPPAASTARITFMARRRVISWSSISSE